MALKLRAVADSIEEAGYWLSTFISLQPGQWKSARTTDAIERLHEELRQRIKTQTVLPEAETAPKARTPREGTKQATLIAMLRAPEGATIEEIMAATGWQSHTVRGAMAGALKKKLGLEVTSEKVEGRGRVYRLPAA